MTKKAIYLPALFLTQAVTGDTTTQIPEGKIIDYPCIHPDITPGAGPRVIDGCNLFITADYLYWIAQEDNLQFASTGHANLPDTFNVNSGTTKSPHFHYRSGFKAGLGWSFGHDVWDSLATYTWYQSNHNKGSLSGDFDAGLTTPFTPSMTLSPGDYFTSASAIWALHFNALDWEIGRNCYVSKHLSLRPFAGLKGSWQNQTFNKTYGGILDGVDPASFNYYSNEHTSFWGVGVRSGLNTCWNLSDSWSFYGDFALSALWSVFQSHRKDSHNAEDAPTTIHSINENRRCNTLSPVLEVGLGVRKDEWFLDNRIHIGAQVGWEEQVWWNQNEFTLDRSAVRGGNLFLQGLTARLRLDF